MATQEKRGALRVGRGAAQASERFLTTFGLLLVVLIGWQILAMAAHATFFPPPLDIAGRAFSLLFTDTPQTLFLSPDFFEQLLPSVIRILLGFGLGSAVGVLAGVAIGASRVLGDYVNPVINYLRAIPATASLPIFILLLGGEDLMRVAFISWAISWYVLINTASGVASVDQTVLEMAAVFRLPRRRRVLEVMIPSAAPQIFAGLRIALTGAILVSVVSEFFLAQNGLGFQMIQAQRRYFVLDMWAWMLVLALLGAILNWLLGIIEGRVLGWHRRSHAVAG